MKHAQVLMSHSEAVKTFHEICHCAKNKKKEEKEKKPMSIQSISKMTKMNYALITEPSSLNSRVKQTNFQKESQKD